MLEYNPIANNTAFLVGMCGAFVIYFVRYQNSRLQLVVRDFKKNWWILFSDLIPFSVCGGLVACFLVCPSSPREAFLAGCTWQGFLVAMIEAAS